MPVWDSARMRLGVGARRRWVGTTTRRRMRIAGSSARSEATAVERTDFSVRIVTHRIIMLL